MGVILRCKLARHNE